VGILVFEELFLVENGLCSWRGVPSSCEGDDDSKAPLDWVAMATSEKKSGFQKRKRRDSRHPQTRFDIQTLGQW
jgi:hypothetical protein